MYAGGRIQLLLEQIFMYFQVQRNLAQPSRNHQSLGRVTAEGVKGSEKPFAMHKLHSERKWWWKHPREEQDNTGIDQRAKRPSDNF